MNLPALNVEALSVRRRLGRPCSRTRSWKAARAWSADSPLDLQADACLEVVPVINQAQVSPPSTAGTSL